MLTAHVFFFFLTTFPFTLHLCVLFRILFTDRAGLFVCLFSKNITVNQFRETLLLPEQCHKLINQVGTEIELMNNKTFYCKCNITVNSKWQESRTKEF